MGWAQFKFDAASETFAPFTMTDTPHQANDTKCGFACHTAAKGKDYGTASSLPEIVPLQVEAAGPRRA